MSLVQAIALIILVVFIQIGAGAKLRNAAAKDVKAASYTSVTAGQSRYVFFYQELLVEIDAQSFCVNRGGTLMTIDSRSKQSLLERVVKRYPDYKHLSSRLIWIAAHFDPGCDVYKDGREKIFFQTEPIRASLGYNNWLPTEPRVEDGTCVQANNAQKFKWWTSDCFLSASLVVCEFGRCGRWFDDPTHCNLDPGCKYDISGAGACLPQPPVPTG